MNPKFSNLIYPCVWERVTAPAAPTAPGDGETPDPCAGVGLAPARQQH